MTTQQRASCASKQLRVPRAQLCAQSVLAHLRLHPRCTHCAAGPPQHWAAGPSPGPPASPLVGPLQPPPVVLPPPVTLRPPPITLAPPPVLRAPGRGVRGRERS